MRTREVKTNALYELGGVICRVKRRMPNHNTFLVCHHKRFFSFAKAAELKKISPRKVRQYVTQFEL